MNDVAIDRRPFCIDLATLDMRYTLNMRGIVIVAGRIEADFGGAESPRTRNRAGPKTRRDKIVGRFAFDLYQSILSANEFSAKVL